MKVIIIAIVTNCISNYYIFFFLQLYCVIIKMDMANKTKYFVFIVLLLNYIVLNIYQKKTGINNYKKL